MGHEMIDISKTGESLQTSHFFEGLTYEVLFEDTIGCVDYAHVISSCLKEGPAFTMALKRGLNSISLKKTYRALDRQTACF